MKPSRLILALTGAFLFSCSGNSFDKETLLGSWGYSRIIADDELLFEKGNQDATVKNYLSQAETFTGKGNVTANDSAITISQAQKSFDNFSEMIYEFTEDSVFMHSGQQSKALRGTYKIDKKENVVRAEFDYSKFYSEEVKHEFIFKFEEEKLVIHPLPNAEEKIVQEFEKLD